MLAAGGKGVLEARAKWVRGLMVVEIAVGLRANAPVQSCTVCCSMWRMVALEGRDACEGESLPRMVMSVFKGLVSSVAAKRDSGAGSVDVTACKWAQANHMATADTACLLRGIGRCPVCCSLWCMGAVSDCRTVHQQCSVAGDGVSIAVDC